MSYEDENQKTKRISITVDRSAELTALEEKLREEQEKREDAEAKLELVAQEQFKKSRSEVAKKVGVSEDSIETSEDLDAYKKISEQNQTRKEVPTGQLPLSSQGHSSEDGFSDFGEMYKHLLATEKTNPESAKALEIIWKKFQDKVKSERNLPEMSGKNPYTKKGEQ